MKQRRHAIALFWIVGVICVMPLLYYLNEIVEWPWLADQLDQRRGAKMIAAYLLSPLLLILLWPSRNERDE
ncbi:hypothetical protein ATE71_00995 [Sphingopyxis sp. H115]|nr:hypothetical protein ATE71_00995 [Sphingopyxis sp. H115]